MKIGAGFVLIASLLTFVCGKGVASTPAVPDETAGYRAVIGDEDGFVAAGSDGVYYLTPTGEVVRSVTFSDVTLNCLIFCGETLLAAGDRGVLLIAPKGEEPQQVESGTTANIRCLTLFQGYVVAGTDGGTVLIGDQAGFFEGVTLALKGNIVSLSGGALGCYGVTDRGEIIRSDDLVNWDILDFNAFYNGYYPPRRFTGVWVADRQVAVAGVSEQGAPVLSLSSGGSVWTERSLDYTDSRGMPALLQEAPRAIIYEAARERFLLACDRGTVMSVPSCSHCNERFDLPTDNALKALTQHNGTILLVGDNHTALPFRF
ncbi:MAG: hypothetical protein LBM20_06050 [Rikenellaceae bacterium]|jgi:hypothetical protein|nr:hypothetical protein [Rikenellaceae bacterium]